MPEVGDHYIGAEILLPRYIANVIAQSMYAQCDADGNEYLLLDVQLDYCKENKAISFAEQLTTI